MTSAITDERLAQRRKAASNAQRPEVEKSLLDDISPETVSEKKPESDKPTTVYRPGALVKPLTSFYETIGGFVILADPDCGSAIVNGAENCAKSLDELARTNPRIRRVLMRMVESGALTKVVVAHLPIILAVLAHHFPKALVYVTQILTGSYGSAEATTE